MPVLSLEPTVWPEDLLLESSPADVAVGSWCVLHTRPRAEKMLARRLLRAGVSFYLPLYEQRKKVQRRTVRSHLPLFPGYVFVCGDHESRQLAFETNLVASCIPVGDQEQLANDLARIFRLIESGSLVTPESRLQPGMPAEITSGPLAGCRGKIIRCSKGARLLVEVSFLQQGASVEVDWSMIQRI
jgi:transcriptional antiterminator RfaH